MNSSSSFAFDTLQHYDELVKMHGSSSSSSSSSSNGTKSDTPSSHNLNVLPVSEGPHSEIAICNFAGLLPFTGEESDYLSVEWAAAAALAIQHLNNGDGSIVKEIQGLPDQCNIRFTFDMYATFFQEQYAVEAVIEATNPSNANPCAFLGPIRTAESMPTSIITGLRGYPQVSPASTGTALEDTELYPLFGRTIPADDATAVAMISYLSEVLEVRYVGILYVNDNYGSSFFAALQTAIQQHAPDMVTVSAEVPVNASNEDVSRAIAMLKNSQYRYFVGILAAEQFDAVVTQAHEQGISGSGSHTWFFSDTANMRLSQSIPTGSSLHKALEGNGIISVSGGLPGTGRTPLLDIFLQQVGQISKDAKALHYILSKTSFPVGKEHGTVQEIQKGRPVFADTAFGPLVYDSVVALGLAACHAEQANQNRATEYFTGKEHFASFKNTTFAGASGEIRFNPDSGSRDPMSSYYVVQNLVASPVLIEARHVRGDFGKLIAVPSGLLESGKWSTLAPFVYSDGSTTQHADLPALYLEENLLTTGWRAAGLAICGLALALSIGFAAWVVVKRESRVVRASQPIFLLFICLGSFIFASSIIPLTIDEGVASMEGCTIACTSFIWLLSIGFSIVFSALFTKTYRVNKIFHQPNFKRVKVTALDVAKPMVAILSANILLLSLMTGLSPFEWNVALVSQDEFGRVTETQGSCDLSGSVPYLVSIAAINFCCLVFVVVQAYTARNISTEYHESEYIFKSLLVILLGCFLSFPVLILTKDNAVAFYFVLSATIGVTSCMILCLVFLPKIHLACFKKDKRHLMNRSNASGPRVLRSSQHEASSQGFGLKVLHNPQQDVQLLERIALLEEQIKQYTDLEEELKKYSGDESGETAACNTQHEATTE